MKPPTIFHAVISVHFPYENFPDEHNEYGADEDMLTTRLVGAAQKIAPLAHWQPVAKLQEGSRSDLRYEDPQGVTYYASVQPIELVC